MDSVPLITHEPEKVNCLTPAVAGAAIAKLLTVMEGLVETAPLMLCVPDPAPENVMLLKVTAGPAMLPARIPEPSVSLIIIVDVPAFKVKFVVVPNAITPVLFSVNVTVELPRLIVRVLLLLDDRDVAVTLLLLVVKVPWVSVIAPEQVKVPPRLNVAADALIVTEITDTL